MCLSSCTLLNIEHMNVSRTQKIINFLNEMMARTWVKAKPLEMI